MTGRVSYEEWMSGDALAVGRSLMEGLAPGVQVGRGLAVLEICRAHVLRVPEVDLVLAIGKDPSRWREGHSVFDGVRVLTLREERARTNDRYRSLLYVAEIVAQTIYNASGSPAPFDPDSPWWLAKNARSFAEGLGLEPVSHALWAALGGNA